MLLSFLGGCKRRTFSGVLFLFGALTDEYNNDNKQNDFKHKRHLDSGYERFCLYDTRKCEKGKEYFRNILWLLDFKILL